MKVGQGRRRDTFCEEQGDFVEVELILETRWWPWSVALVPGAAAPSPRRRAGVSLGTVFSGDGGRSTAGPLWVLYPREEAWSRQNV